jgi:hypothetical protein
LLKSLNNSKNFLMILVSRKWLKIFLLSSILKINHYHYFRILKQMKPVKISLRILFYFLQKGKLNINIIIFEEFNQIIIRLLFLISWKKLINVRMKFKSNNRLKQWKTHQEWSEIYHTLLKHFNFKISICNFMNLSTL